MANAITSVPVGQSAEELLIQPLLDNPTVSELGIPVTIIRKAWKLYLLPQLGNITQKKVSCGWNYATGVGVTEKPVTPVELAGAIEQCYEVFMNTYFADKLPAGSMRGELGAEIQGILLDLFNEAYANDVLRIFFLGDTANLTTDDNGVQLFSAMNGVYKKLSADTAVPNAGTITDTDLLPANIEATLFRVYNAQSRRLRAMNPNDKKFWVTASVYDAYKRYLQLGNGTQVVVYQSVLTQNAVSDRVTYQDIEVVPLRFVDDLLAAYFIGGSPVEVENPHRIILTAPANHQLGLDKDAFGDSRAWYSNDDDVYRIVGSTLIGYEYGWSDLNVIAGF